MRGLPAVITRRSMPPWRLTKEHLKAASRGNVERLARWCGAERPDRWSDRQLVRRAWRATNVERKQIVREQHLVRARRQDVERLARWVGLRPTRRWRLETLIARVWAKVDVRGGRS